MFNLINYIFAGGFLAFIGLGALASAREFPKAALWRTRGIVAAVVYIALASYSPFLWASWLDGPLWFDVTGIPLWGQIVLGYAAIQLISYWWHRMMHESDILWRVFHQMHHSVERMDGWGALYHSPLDTIGFVFAGSFALTMLVGISPTAAAIVGVIGAFAVFFTHCNIRTPRWIGWIFQRPEGHGRHHQRGHHANNYAELVIWDRLFGTYENPKEWNGQSGFYDGASLRIGDMLTFKDVSEPIVETARNPRKSFVGASAAVWLAVIYAGTMGLLVAGTASTITMAV